MDLLSLTSQFQYLAAKIIESGGEITPEIEQHLKDLEKDIAKKGSSIVFIRERLEQEAEYWNAKASTYQKLAKSCREAKTRLGDRLKAAMRSLDMWELHDGENRIVLAPMKAKVVIDDEKKLPSNYFTETVVRLPNSESIRKDLEAGLSVPGARLESVVALRTYVRKEV